MPLEIELHLKDDWIQGKQATATASEFVSIVSRRRRSQLLFSDIFYVDVVFQVWRAYAKRRRSFKKVLINFEHFLFNIYVWFVLNLWLFSAIGILPT